MCTHMAPSTRASSGRPLSFTPSVPSPPSSTSPKLTRGHVQLSRLEESDLGDVDGSDMHKILADWDKSWDEWRQAHSPVVSNKKSQTNKTPPYQACCDDLGFGAFALQEFEKSLLERIALGKHIATIDAVKPNTRQCLDRLAKLLGASTHLLVLLFGTGFARYPAGIGAVIRYLTRNNPHGVDDADAETPTATNRKGNKNKSNTALNITSPSPSPSRPRSWPLFDVISTLYINSVDVVTKRNDPPSRPPTYPTILRETLRSLGTNVSDDPDQFIKGKLRRSSLSQIVVRTEGQVQVGDQGDYSPELGEWPEDEADAPTVQGEDHQRHHTRREAADRLFSSPTTALGQLNNCHCPSAQQEGSSSDCASDLVAARGHFASYETSTSLFKRDDSSLDSTCSTAPTVYDRADSSGVYKHTMPLMSFQQGTSKPTTPTSSSLDKDVSSRGSTGNSNGNAAALPAAASAIKPPTSSFSATPARPATREGGIPDDSRKRRSDRNDLDGSHTSSSKRAKTSERILVGCAGGRGDDPELQPDLLPHIRLEALNDSITCLDPGKFLDDNIVNAWVARFCRQADGIYMVDSQVVETTSLPSSAQRAKFVAMLRRSESVLFPFCIRSKQHWLLLRWQPATKKLKVYDSNRLISPDTGPDCPSQIVAKWLDWAYGGNNTASGLHVRHIECPQQRNEYDCGVYVIEFAEQVCDGRADMWESTTSKPPIYQDLAARRQYLRDTLFIRGEAPGLIDPRFSARAEVTDADACNKRALALAIYHSGTRWLSMSHQLQLEAQLVRTRGFNANTYGCLLPSSAGEVSQAHVNYEAAAVSSLALQYAASTLRKSHRTAITTAVRLQRAHEAKKASLEAREERIKNIRLILARGGQQDRSIIGQVIDIETALPALSEAMSTAANLQLSEADDKLDAAVVEYAQSIHHMAATCDDVRARNPVSQAWRNCLVLMIVTRYVEERRTKVAGVEKALGCQLGLFEKTCNVA